MNRINDVKAEVVKLWKTHLHPKDFKQKLESYLITTDWHKTIININGDDLTIMLYDTDDDGYEFSIKMKKQ